MYESEPTSLLWQTEPFSFGLTADAGALKYWADSRPQQVMLLPRQETGNEWFKWWGWETHCWRSSGWKLSGSTEEFSPAACMDTRTWGHLWYAVHPLNDPLNDEVERHCRRSSGWKFSGSTEESVAKELAWTQEPWTISAMLCVLGMTSDA